MLNHVHGIFHRQRTGFPRCTFCNCILTSVLLLIDLLVKVYLENSIMGSPGSSGEGESLADDDVSTSVTVSVTNCCYNQGEPGSKWRVKMETKRKALQWTINVVQLWYSRYKCTGEILCGTVIVKCTWRSVTVHFGLSTKNNICISINNKMTRKGPTERKKTVRKWGLRRVCELD